MNTVNTGADTNLSEVWISRGAVFSAGTTKGYADVYVGGAHATPVAVMFDYPPEVKHMLPNIRKMLSGERHVSALVQAGPNGTLLLKQLTTGSDTRKAPMITLTVEARA